MKQGRSVYIMGYLSPQDDSSLVGLYIVGGSEGGGRRQPQLAFLLDKVKIALVTYWLGAFGHTWPALYPISARLSWKLNWTGKHKRQNWVYVLWILINCFCFILLQKKKQQNLECVCNKYSALELQQNLDQWWRTYDPGINGIVTIFFEWPTC